MKKIKKLRLIARVSGILIFTLIFPFYIGYGLPLPDSSMSLLENIWLIIMPLFLVGSLIAMKWEKLVDI